MPQYTSLDILSSLTLTLSVLQNQLWQWYYAFDSFAKLIIRTETGRFTLSYHKAGPGSGTGFWHHGLAPFPNITKSYYHE